MKKKFFLSLMTLCMVLSLCSVSAFAAASDDTESAATNVAEVNGEQYTTLEAALEAAKENGTVKLLTNVSDVTIPQNTVVTIDLNGKTISSTSGHAIMNNGTLTVTGSGTVDGGTTAAKGAIYNAPDATATLNGGTFTGSKWYVVKNLGTMTIDGASVEQNDIGSSAIDNGFYGSNGHANDCGASPAENQGSISLTISSGSVSGGINCVKNDDYGSLTITGGEFTTTASDGAVIMNWNEATISGGTFTGDGTAAVVSNGYLAGGADQGKLTITGGDFTATDDGDLFGTGSNVSGAETTISGGTFTGTANKVTVVDTTVNSGTFSGDVSDYLSEDADGVEYNVVLKAAACTANGIGKLIKIEGGETTTSYYVIPASHKAAEAVKENEVEASCTETGSYDSVVYCSVCGEELTRETVTVEALGHTEPDDVTTVEATCAEDGSKSYTCSACGETVEEVIPATGEHTWVDSQYIAATCTENGKAGGQICSVCGAENPDDMPEDLGDVDPATDHDWVLDETAEGYQPATCVADGVGTYKCSECSATKTEVIPATGEHTEDVVDAKEPTCGEAGYTEGLKCSVCGEILYGCKEIPATGEHTEETVAGKPATCTTTGLTDGVKCSVCGEILVAQEEIPVDPDAHNYEVTVLKAATCTATGVGKYVCSECGASKYATIPAEHSWNEGEVTKAATCTEAGEKTYTCSVCGETKTEEIEATGHTWNDGVVTKEPTCGEEGEKTYTCSVCQETKTEVIEATGEHTYEESVIDATCTEPAMVGEICSVCGQAKGELTPVGEPNGHQYEEQVTKEATCVEDGEKTYTCSVCDDSYTEVIPATGEHEDEFVAAKEPTCVEAGNTEGVKCSECGEILYGCEEIPATGVHTEETVAGKPATCKDTGLTDGVKCSVCGEILVAQEEIPVDPDAHNYGVTPLKAATCTTTGIGKYTCSICGDYYYATIPASHTWGEGEVTEEATCGKDGVKTYTCTVEGCSQTKTEVIPATGEHDYQENVVEATCTENAKVAFMCSVCDAVDPDRETVEVPDTMIPHSYEEETVEATCTEDGSVTKTCSVCGDEVVEVIPATGHKAGESEYINATCTENGKEVVKCAVCGEILEENDMGELDPATGHTEETVPAVAATCGATGLTEGVKCSVCGEILVAQEETPIDESAHNYEVKELKAASCSATGIGKYTCSICGDSYYGIIEKTAHTFDENSAEITKQPTCTEAGTLTVSCSVCGETEERAIEALGHTWSDEKASDDGAYVYKECSVCHEIDIIAWIDCKHETTELQNVKEATCTEDGYTGDTVCTTCGETVEAGEVISALDHTPAEAIRENEVAATETEDGSYDSVVYCTVCGEELSRETVTIPATGPAVCEHETTETQNAKEATCTEDGYTGDVVCTDCGETVEAGEEIPALGHTAAEAIRENEVAATETEDGSYDSVVYCTVCGEELSRETVTIPATGPAVCEHETTELQNAKEATCTEDGYTGDVVCTDCGETVATGAVIPAKGHTEVTDAVVEATCGSTGLTEGSHCSECGEVIVAQEVVPATGKHDYDATINDDGSVTYTCPVCGDSFTEAL